MPLNPINIGSVGNDGSGDPIRDAFSKINLMFTEVYAGLSQKATSEQLGAFVTDVGTNIAALGLAIQGKADSSLIAAKADIASVARIDQDAPLQPGARLQLASNTGMEVSFPVIAFAHDEDIEAGEFVSFVIPNKFIVSSVWVTASHVGGGQLTAALRTTDGDTVASCADAPFTLTGLTGRIQLNRDIEAILAGKELKFVVTSYHPDYLEPAAKGLTVWLRGVWKND